MASVVWEVVTSLGFFKIFIASQSKWGGADFRNPALPY
jgi:hypothetical protein